MNIHADSVNTKKQKKTAETTEEQKQSETGKTAATNYDHSVAGSYKTDAATSLFNKLQMRRHYKVMLMRPASAPWDCHPRSLNVDTECTSESVERDGGGGEKIIINIRHPLCLHETFREPR